MSQDNCSSTEDGAFVFPNFYSGLLITQQRPCYIINKVTYLGGVRRAIMEEQGIIWVKRTVKAAEVEA